MTLQANTGALTQQELESRLWAAADCLRGPVDPGDFKAYVFPLLFLKRISDTWDAEQHEALADYGGDLPPEALPDYHRFVVPEGCHWIDLRRATENVGVTLQTILDRIQEANPATLAGIFGEVAWGNKDRLPEHALINLIDVFDGIRLDPKTVDHDMLGNAYEYLLRQFAEASGKKAGEFFTPRAVVRLLTRLLNPQPGETIYDPACGSGGMLIEAVNEVREAGGDTRTLRLYGQEVNLTTAAIARMNLYMHDIEDFKVLRGDTLREPKFRDTHGALAQFDIVIANPPFSLKNWGADTWTHDPYRRASCGVPPARSADFAWIQHMVASMNAETGRVGVVMPLGVLFRGDQEGEIRRRLIEADLLEAVVALPPNLFYSTGIPASLLILRAVKPFGRRSRVFFIDASRALEKGRNQHFMTESHVDAVVDAYRNGEHAPSGIINCAFATIDLIRQNQWDLNIARYLRDQEETRATGVTAALAELASAKEALDAADQCLRERLREGGYA